MTLNDAKNLIEQIRKADKPELKLVVWSLDDALIWLNKEQLLEIHKEALKKFKNTRNKKDVEIILKNRDWDLFRAAEARKKVEEENKEEEEAKKEIKEEVKEEPKEEEKKEEVNKKEENEEKPEKEEINLEENKNQEKEPKEKKKRKKINFSNLYWNIGTDMLDKEYPWVNVKLAPEEEKVEEEINKEEVVEEKEEEQTKEREEVKEEPLVEEIKDASEEEVEEEKKEKKKRRKWFLSFLFGSRKKKQSQKNLDNRSLTYDEDGWDSKDSEKMTDVVWIMSDKEQEQYDEFNATLKDINNDNYVISLQNLWESEVISLSYRDFSREVFDKRYEELVNKYTLKDDDHPSLKHITQEIRYLLEDLRRAHYWDKWREY